MKRKIGDRVRVKSLDWYEANKNEDGSVDCGIDSLVDDMAKYLGKVAVIIAVDNDRYKIDIDNQEWGWTDEMLGGFDEFVKYEHHGAEVSVRENLKGLHRDHCLCHSCSELDKCITAKELFKLNKRFGITTPVWECPNFNENK